MVVAGWDLAPDVLARVVGRVIAPWAAVSGSSPEKVAHGSSSDIALTAIGWLIGVVSVGFTIYYQRKSVRIDRLRKSLGWEDLQGAAKELGKQIQAVGKPVAILTPNLAGGTFVNLLADRLEGQPPTFVGIRIWKEDPHPDIEPSDYFGFSTAKCFNWIPREIAKFKSGMVLIVDDFAMSGAFLAELIEKLVSEGIPKSNIYSATIAVTRVALKRGTAPDFFWWVTDDDEFYFPWGKAR